MEPNSQQSNNQSAAGGNGLVSSQRSSRSRKQAQLKSQNAKMRDTMNSSSASGRVKRNSANDQRNASISEYNKTGGPGSAKRQNIRSIRGTSEESNGQLKQQQSSVNLESTAGGVGGGLGNPEIAAESLQEMKGAINQMMEEAKQTASSKSNSMTAAQKRDFALSNASSKAVSKKKKSKQGTVSGTVSSKDNVMRDTSQSKAIKSKKPAINSQPMSDKSLTQKDESGVISSVSPMNLTKKLKSGSSASARNNVTKSEKAKMRSTAGIIVAPLDSQPQNNNIIVNQSMAPEQMMQSTIKSGLSGRDQSKSVNNWEQQSQNPSDKQKKMMATTGAISPRAAKKLQMKPNAESEIPQPQETTEDRDLLALNTSELNTDPDENKKSAANLPASPASKPSKINTNRPTPLDLTGQHSSIAELEDDSPTQPVSAGPIMRVPQPESQAAGFGIRLQKLEVTSNLSVTKPLESSFQSAMKNSENKRGANAPYLEEHSKPSILEATPSSLYPAGLGETPDRNADSSSKAKAVVPDMTEPLPILPKVTTVIHMPVKCPIENVRFVQLKRFQQFQKAQAELMTAGFDLVGQRRKMIQLKTEEKILKKGGIDDQQQLAKIDDTTHFIKSIVYARNPKIIDLEKQHVHQRDAFGHMNNLDVKTLVAKTQYLGEESKYASLSPRNVQRMRPRDSPTRMIMDSQVYKLKDAEDKTLLFESRFESGNLYLAQKVSDQEYNLLMSNDINTAGHTQWFFFQVRNTKAKNKVRFNILNYSKPDSLFNYGMKVSVYSDKKSERKNMGWHKDGEDIRYFQNGIRKDVTYYSKSYYTATFTYTFEYDDDLVYFAYSVPYTYSDLRNDISAIMSDPERRKLVRTAVLCRTLSGEPCEVLTITSADNLENFRQRKGVVLTARVHPGETVGSWMMRGALTFLTDPDNVEAKMLRENFVFKVVPMLNPDGVINGNYRCSLAGCDLNRRWKTPNKTLHPTIFHCKRLIKQIHQERGLVLYCDFHGHSRKQNVFMYGCNNKQNPGECRIFPFILSKMNNYFCYEYSRFGVQKSKEQTARVALYKDLKNVPNIYTMESSFAGLDAGPSAGKHFTTDMLETLGHDVCRSILIYCNLYVPPELTDQPFFKNILLQQQAQKAANAKPSASNLDKKKFKEQSFNMKDAIMGEINNNAALLNCSGGDDSSSGSDSAPSEDNMQAEELIKQLPTADKTLKQQLKKNEIKRKTEEAQQAQSTVKLRRPSSGRNLKKDEPPKRQMSPLKKPQANKEEQKPEEKKKPKVETRDVCTQTDRSDYQLIKAKMLKERKLKEEQAALLAAQDSRAKAQNSVSTERQMINDLNNISQGGYPGGQMNTTQRLQQMVGIEKSRTTSQKMPLSQHFSQNPLKQPGVVGGVPNTLQQQSFRTNNQNPNQPNRVGPSQGGAGQQMLNNPNQKIMIPDKNKYNFMGVSSINKHGQQLINQGAVSQQQAHHPNNNDNEYGTTIHAQRQGIVGTNSAKLSPTRPEVGYGAQVHDSQNLYQASQPGKIDSQKQQQKIQETIKINQHAKNMELEISLNNKSGVAASDSRKGGNRGVSGGTGKLPAMTTLSANTTRSMRDHMAVGQPSSFMANAKLIGNHSNNTSIRNQQQIKGGANFDGSQRSQNFDTEPSTQHQGMFSPNTDQVTGKPQFMLPQTKQLPQKEFKMMEVGVTNNNVRKGSRNPKSVNSHNAPNSIHNHNGSQSHSQKSYGQSKFNSTSSYQSHQMQPPSQQPARFNTGPQPHPQSINSTTEQTLARNNSTHCKVTANGKYAGPLGSSPMNKLGQMPQSGAHPSPADQFSSQLQEMTLSSNLVTRNNAPGGTVTTVPHVQMNNPNSNSILGGGGSQTGQHDAVNKKGATQPLRSSFTNNQQFTPQSKPGSWQNSNQFLETSANQNYRAMGGSIPITINGAAHAEHDQNCSKLPSLNLRGQPKSNRSDSKSFHQNPNGTNSHQNASGMIGGLNIVLNSGQGPMHTPNQKKAYQIGNHNKYQSNLIQPQMIQANMQVVGGGGAIEQAQVVGAANNSQVSQPVMGGSNNNAQSTASANNSSASAAHKRNAHGAIFSINGAASQQVNGQKMQPMQLVMKSGSRTPSQQEIIRSSGAEGGEFLPKQATRGGMHVHQSPGNNNLGSLSLENNHLHDYDLTQSPKRSRANMKVEVNGGSQATKPLAGSMVSRLRNQSEIADTRNAGQQNYGTFDARGPHSNAQQRQGGAMVVGTSGTTTGLQQSMYGAGGQTAASKNLTNQIMTPQNTYGKKSIIPNNAQGKVVGKRYSRH